MSAITVLRRRQGQRAGRRWRVKAAMVQERDRIYPSGLVRPGGAASSVPVQAAAATAGPPGAGGAGGAGGGLPTRAELATLGHVKRRLLAVLHDLCVGCSGGAPRAVRGCGLTTCPAWPYRLGRDPFLARHLTPEQRAAAADRMRSARQHRRGPGGHTPAPVGQSSDPGQSAPKPLDPTKRAK